MSKQTETLTEAEKKLLRKPIARVELIIWEKTQSSVEVTLVNGKRLTNKQTITACIKALQEHRRTI